MAVRTRLMKCMLAAACFAVVPVVAAAHGAEPAASVSAPAGWYYSRGEAQLRVVKGEIEEIWRRESRGQVSFERIFHDDKRRVFYASGELRTMGLEVDWDRAVELITHSGLREELPGTAAALPDSTNYERLDAADLGDMDYDAFARKAEAYDVKLGWRQVHEH